MLVCEVGLFGLVSLVRQVKGETVEGDKDDRRWT